MVTKQKNSYDFLKPYECNQSDGVIAFDQLPLKVAKRILELFPNFSDNTINNAPTLSEFIKLGDAYPNTLFRGYRYLPERVDAHGEIMFDGCYIDINDLTVNSQWNNEETQLLLDLIKSSDEATFYNLTIELWWD
jgi:hypothetical protein